MKSKWTVGEMDITAYILNDVKWMWSNKNKSTVHVELKKKNKKTECEYRYGLLNKLAPWGPIYFAGLQALSNGCLHDRLFFVPFMTNKN